MKKYYIGIDCGSTMCKAVCWGEGKIIDFHITKTGWNGRQSAQENLEYLLGNNGLRAGDVFIAATGYGREAIDFADCTFTEITCHALGASYLSPDIVGVIDIGGQDSKVIQIENGKIINFLMNDKCAAGTGRFLTMACETLDISMDKIDDFTDKNDAIHINSMCTVFAESEIIGSLAMQKDRKKIMAGILYSIAQKIKQMSGKLNFCHDKPFLMTGGLSRSKMLIDIISKTIEHEVKTHKHAIYAGAIGACVCAASKYSRI